MLDVVAFIAIFVTVIRLFLSFRKLSAIYLEFKQTTHIRYLILLCLLAPIFMLLTLLAPSLIIFTLFVCAILFFPSWTLARKQYHFFDTQGTARVRRAQEWLSQVQTLSILGWAYVALNAMMMFVSLFVGSNHP